MISNRNALLAPLVVIVSESSTKGGGHVNRQLAIVEEAISRGFKVFVMGQLSALSCATFRKFGAKVLPVRAQNRILSEASKLLESIEQRNSRIAVVIDDYSLHSISEQLLSPSRMVVVFTDGQNLPYVPQLQVDSARLAQTAPASAGIFGIDAAIISRKMKALREERRSAPAGTRGTSLKFVVNFGSADYADNSFLLYGLLADLVQNSRFEIVLGPLYRGKLVDSRIKPIKNVLITPSPHSEYLSVLNEANVAIGASGLSAFERAFLGLPSLNFAVAGNQIGIAQILSRAGAALEGKYPITATALTSFMETMEDHALYQTMSAAGMNAVDGQGASRVISRIVEEAQSVEN